ncbi:dehydrogenase/reductase SDR family member 11-like [Schistocerca nitens]|uniref:dehydrogenase/reductase SDR family member 11-like n=1 Tax=Schistocerca nitens TaxID=7011 RepID=UPI002117BE89|nr:dehydrogenase/reductase SDR family member 11-like [Schistocerca nitens]
MERYAGRVALVTGANSGIGAATARALLRRGLEVVGLDKRIDRVQARELKDAPGRLYPLQCDVSCEENVLRAFKWIKENLGGVDVLINSAGICRENLPTTGQTAEWRHTLDVNVLGLSVCTREAVQSMLDRGVDDGFVIHICSIAGHIMPFDPLCSMYHASKHAVRALLEGLRMDLVARNSKIGMERYAGRVALATGANSGIGAATARVLLRRGLEVVGLDKRIDRVQLVN